MTTTKAKPWRSVLRVHPAAESWPELSPAELTALGSDIDKHGLRVPLVIWQPEYGPPLLLDGRSRLSAMQLVGMKVLDDAGDALSPDIIRMCKLVDRGDPVVIARSLNEHRRHLDQEQRRNAIERLLQLDPSKSDRLIADEIKASPTTVGKVRAKMEAAGDVSTVDTRTDSKGRKVTKRKKATKAKDARAAFILIAVQAAVSAAYEGPIEDEVIAAVDDAAGAWALLAHDLHLERADRNLPKAGAA